MHVAMDSTEKVELIVMSQSPVQRVYCCMKVEEPWVLFMDPESQSPVQRVYCCMTMKVEKETKNTIRKSQSPVQRVYCCMRSSS